MTKRQSLKQLRNHLSELFLSRHNGTSNIMYSKTQGYVDGYMQALSDAGIFDENELLEIVSQERLLAAQQAEKAYLGYRQHQASPANSFA
ncbi:MAG: hypothetical protein JXR91_00300 [Deltaproteobacteria bacterium]|nr:hypothetical protein [Deltaproteobacteria bacterium]